ncbi:unnamed protein product, partial [Enterobius vermicularis]|uniref:SH3 domain-containing protein n=1 Tax=Enterobius vermicularis TaxID=51028 RepID=A0A0N4USI7_ENTVE
MASTDDREKQSSSSAERSDAGKSIPVYAKAKFSFEGRNNDELSFKKGDIIAVTQQLDGGWWEGTFASHTGWFPSGYVAILDDAERMSYLGGNVVISDDESVRNLVAGNDSSRAIYRKQILDGFLESERSYIEKISEFYNNMLMRILDEKKIPEEEFAILCGNLQEIIVYQQEILSEIQEAVTKNLSNAKVGGILLNAAPKFRSLLHLYCTNHPRAIDLVLKSGRDYRSLIKSCGSNLKEFIFNLSLPFRHLEKYATTLNELERSMHSTHADKGNAQRATVVFREIASFCTSLRKQKELQLELKRFGLIEGLPSSQLEALGEILYMGSVSLGDEETLVEDHLPVDRCLVLFSSTLLILEPTQNLNAYSLKQKISTDGLVVKKVDAKAALSIVSADGSFNTLMTVPFIEELQRWVESFGLCPNVEIDENCFTLSNTA